jgi:hypothetical protein
MPSTNANQLRPLAAAGLTLIPLHNHRAATADGRPLGKSPRDRAWQAKDYSAFDAAAHMAGGDNVGVRLDGLVVCDADPRNYGPGDDPLARAASDGLLPRSAPRVLTGGGGAHVYMRLPAGHPPTVETLPSYPGLEFKRGPKQVVAPGSVHPSGRAYELDPFDDDFTAIPDAPAALLGMLARPEPAGGAEWATHEPEQVARMLSALDPSEHRGGGPGGAWFEIMCACHHMSGGDAVEEFVEWSAGDPAYAGLSHAVRARWDSLSREGAGAGAITGATLHHYLQRAGRSSAWEAGLIALADDFDDDTPVQAVAAPPANPADLPTIRVRDGALIEMLDAAKAALFAGAGGEVLQRHGQLVRPVRLGDKMVDGAVRHQAGATVLMPVNETWLVKRMAQTARWYRVTHQKPKDGEEQGKAKNSPADPPQKVAKTILTDQGAWPFHHVRGLVAAPTIDVSTGQVVDRPGIDPETGLLAEFDPHTFPPIDRDVGRDGARERLRRVEHALFRDMPFSDGPSRAVAMSALVTALVRPTMRAAPMHLFDAAMPGTGKSKMASVVGVVATGVEPSASAWATSEDENEKRLSALLRRGAPVVLFDNVDSRRGDRLGGNMLNIVLTQDPASIRVLGKTEEETLNTRVLMMATGNNIAVAGDCCRRAVKCRLDARCAEPERRRFDWDPVQAAKDARPRLVADLLEALSAYISAGRPSDPPPLGSFEDWTVVRGLLLWCGLDDPADTMADVKATDAAGADLVRGLETWWMAFEDEWVTAADLAAFLEDETDLEHALGRELFEGQEAMQETVFAGRRDKGWIGKALLERSGVAAGAFYLEVEKGKRASRFRVTRPSAD